MSMIYKVTNKINDKIYIGFTGKELKIRKHQHKHFAIKRNSPLYFHKAIRKYGWDNFHWEVIYESWDQEHCLTNMEPFFITEYDSFGKNGYNMDKGGRKGMLGVKRGPVSEETKKKISDTLKVSGLKGKNHPMYGTIANDNFLKSAKVSMLGKNHSDETKKKQSDSRKEHLKENDAGMLGKKHSDETKQQMKLKHKFSWELYDEQTKQYTTINDLMLYCDINNIKYKTVYSWKYKMIDGHPRLKKREKYAN